MRLKAALEKLATLDEQIGGNWFKHARAAGAADDLLRVVIADGSFTTKIDGWIHAATLTTRSIARFAGDDGPPPLDMAEATAWTGGNPAVRYGRWQTDFHWRIDTRLWQYVIYLKFMRDAYRDAIDESAVFSGEERDALKRVVTEFFDQAEIAMAYRWEFIERGRGFSRHPDGTAGATTHGYTYRVELPLPEIPFEDLALDLDTEGAGEGRHVRGREIPAFPRLDGTVDEGEHARVARVWFEHARTAGIADRWLRVRLGERMVPTRFNGWETALEMTAPPLARFAAGERAVAAAVGDLDLGDYAVRFGLCQAEFQRRLRGGATELVALLDAERRAMREEAGRRAGASAVGRGDVIEVFFARVARTVRETFASGREVDESWLAELGAMRPLHPRFAPHDPLEPLPWEPSNPETYQRKMERLGYVI